MRVSVIRTAASAVAALLILLLVLPMTAAFAATATKVPNGEEAWFLAKKEPLAEPEGGDPTCDLPVGCNASGQAQRPNNHPEGTLVVAANAGDPDAQTFFNFDFFDTKFLPSGAIVTGGTVTMPVAQDPDARNFRPQAAKMVACMLKEDFIPGGTDAGSFKDRPDVNDKICVDVKKTKDDPLTYSFDLERFGKAWSGGAAQTGVTVMVDPEVKAPNPEETWRVVFNSRRRSEKPPEDTKDQFKFPKITSTLQYRVEKLPTVNIPTVPVGGGDFSSGGSGGGGFPPPESGSSGSPSFSTGSTGSTGGGSFDTGATTGGTSGDFGAPAAAPADSGVIDAPQEAAPPPVDAPVAAADAAPAEQPVLAQPAAAKKPGFSPAVWVLPLLAVAMAGAMAWSLMSPAQLAADREGAVSKLMRTRRLQAADASSQS